MSNLSDQHFLVHKKEITQHTYKTENVPELNEGDVLLKINQYAFTSNNITYAVVGEQMKYWNFFPAEAPFGVIPVWGYSEVVDSKNAAIEVGTTYFGYYPMRKYLKVEPTKISDYGFLDGSAHRQEMASLYNNYEKAKPNDYVPVFRPLFGTSFLSYHFLKNENFFGAENVILTSASSKTSLGQAFLLSENKAEDKKKVIGLTSEKNKKFVEETGFYDLVLSYDEVNQLPKVDTVLVDMAGNDSVLNQVYAHLGIQLKYASMIGLTDWKSDRSKIKVPNAKFFFAPHVAMEFGKKWGQQELWKQIGKALQNFIVNSSKWIKIERIHNHDDLASLYDDMVSGKVDPTIGYLVEIE